MTNEKEEQQQKPVTYAELPSILGPFARLNEAFPDGVTYDGLGDELARLRDRQGGK